MPRLIATTVSLQRFLPGLLVCLLLSAGGPVAAATAPAAMQAAVVHGGRILIVTVPRPTPRAGEILVRVHDASVNPADWKRANGKPEDPDVGRPPPASAAIPGLDAAGFVAEVGAGVTRFRRGQAVLLWSRRGGTYAQYVVVPAGDAAAMPAGLSFAQAAGIPHAGLAAWNLLVDVAHVHAGQSVLVLGGAGGVGSAAVQIARQRQARVIATASARNSSYLRALGAATVIDYQRQHFEEQLRDVDVVVNTVDADNAYRGLSVIRRGGVLASLTGLPDPVQCAARSAICSGRRPGGTPVSQVLEQLARWDAHGDFTINVDRTFDLRETLQAWSYSQAGHTRGKVIIHVAD
jgi:NADPH:quinone reductase-like Zn-dependent oxidoreductase